MNHYDILAKTISKLKREQRTPTFGKEESKKWSDMMHDVYALFKYGESLYDKPQIVIPYPIDNDRFLAFEDLSAVPQQNLIFKLISDGTPIGYAISEELPGSVKKIDPNADESQYWFVKEVLSDICEKWESEYKEATENYLKSQMQDYVRKHMNI